ncbi:class II fumarate hydratase [Pseudomonas entomophila]|uniref:class II fumarate hydratase n=1 Tax=Pseudomonas entomophila TaxID=312306 RepID=UPI0023D8AD8F|nr:class II fumarate hydratase [Pseudomonas entomophila]MDF0730788.1 class II fumarate hydratase [Pseudomonas entomophila]
MHKVRIEHDAFGAVEIPADKYWGAQTQRALAVFGAGREQFPASLLHAFGQQKLASARANRRLGALDGTLSEAIEQAAQELAAGQLDSHFPLTLWQTGSGTQTNMNANEVIANRANQLLGHALGGKSPVHPNDHVNRSQSSNDTFPTVMHLATRLALGRELLPALAHLQARLDDKARQWDDVLKIGRTHLMDAVPMTQGQAFAAFAAQVGHGIDRVQGCLPRLSSLPQGGTAVGTGLNTPAGFDEAFCEALSDITQTRFTPNPCKFEGMGTHDVFVEVSGVLNVLAVSLTKLANDLRLLSSGPRCGLAELVVPDDGLTSSIMPGKRNPTIAEVLAQACMQVMGNHTTVSLAGASSLFELNVAKPVIIHNVLQSIDVLARSVMIFTDKLLAGLEVNRAALARNVEGSLLLATALNPVLGYDQVARITRKAADEGLTPKEAAVALGLLTAQEYDAHVRPQEMVGG